MRAHRNTRSVKRQSKIENLFTGNNLLVPNILNELAPYANPKTSFYHGRIFKIKEKTDNEKGVLLIKYTEIFTRLTQSYDMDMILSDYRIVLEPSYSGNCAPEILQFLKYDNCKIIVQSAEKLDFDFLKRLNKNLIPLRIGSSDWVDHRLFTDLNLEKEYDCIMVAMWHDIKRHYSLFKAIRDMHDPTYKVCLVGGPWSRTKDDIEKMADYYGIRENLKIYERLPPDQVNELLNKSKVNILLTLKEGANKSIFEGLFANVPCIVLDNNIGLNKNSINEHTGKLVPESKLKDTLVWFRDGYKQFNAREWALKNISCTISSHKIDKELAKISAEDNEPWTNPVSVKVNRPECEYFDQNNKLTPFDHEKYKRSG